MGGQFVVSLGVGFCVLWIRNDIRHQLKGYVTQKEFSQYQEAHDKWGLEVVKRMQTSIEDNNRRMERIENKLDRLMERGET